MDNEFIIEETNPEIEIGLEETNIDISEEVANIIISDETPNIDISEEAPELRLIFNERGPRGLKGEKGDTALFYPIVDQEKLNGYTQSSTMENDVKYTYIRDDDNIVIETIKEVL